MANWILTACLVVLNIIMAVSIYRYRRSSYDGDIHIVETEDGKVYSLVLDSDPNDLDKRKRVIFRVGRD